MNVLLGFLIYWAVGCFYMWGAFFGTVDEEDADDPNYQEAKDMVAVRDATLKANPLLGLVVFLIMSVIWPILWVHFQFFERNK